MDDTKEGTSQPCIITVQMADVVRVNFYSSKGLSFDAAGVYFYSSTVCFILHVCGCTAIITLQKQQNS